MSIGKYELIESDTQLAMQWEGLKFAQFLVNNIADAAFCIGADSQFLYVNDATCRMSEYSRQELLSMKLQDIDVYWRNNGLEQWRSLDKSGSLTYKSHYEKKGGWNSPVEVKIKYVEYQGTEIGCAFVSETLEELSEVRQQYIESLQVNLQQGVVEYRRTEHELATSLSILRSTLESTANGILAVNFEGEILYYNRKYVDLWQIPISIGISKNSSDLAKAFFLSKVKDSELFLKAIWDLPANSNYESYDLIELKDGRIFAHYSEPQRIGEKVIGRVWSIWDITQSKRTEEALKLNEARFRILAETTDASIFIIQDEHICYVNPAAEVLTGYTQKEFFNNFDINQLFKSKKLRQVHKQDGGGGYCEYQEIQIVAKNGMERWLACTVEVLDGVLDFAKKPVQLITAIDITDYKQADLELRQALDQAKRLSELRERFVSMLCHQFRTPLNVVSFSADLLKRHIHHWTQEKNRSYLDMIQASVQQISELLDEILLFGRAEAAKLKCDPRPLDLNQFCRDIIAQIQLADGNRKLVSFVSQGNCKTAHLDPKLLQHILTNLLSNAIKYSCADSKVDLEIFCQPGHVVFKVKDAGIGIPVVDQQQIFEPFYRGSNVDSIPGTGLGLSIVKTLVELHGGQITVESEVGLGTTFTLKLPSK
ncbi:MAG: PAS domain-containing sensor histidine kinase [Rhizonema sp. PD38]|nr:PAS domain-containing sensor histidine kinase [Rhizonema sp. PD38]